MDYQYRVGGSLAHNHPTYVERKADRDLLKALKNGTFCYVFNCRQMGKSSLRVRVTHALQEMGMACASVDITSIGSDDNLSKWYNGVITRLFLGFNLTGKVNIKTWLKDRENLSPVQRLGQFIEEVLLTYVSGRIFIFIDEIDKILSLKFSLDDFFSLIRYCYNQRAENPDYERITFALFGVATPSDLIREKTQTSFNIGEAIELTGFTLDEVKPLENGFQDRVNEPRKVIDEILLWTGGQPFLTQKVCQLILDSGSIDPDVDSIIQENIIHNWESKDEPIHFRTIADRLLRDERKAGRFLGIYQKILENGSIEYDDSPEQSELRLTGLVVKKDGHLFVYNPMYRAIFNSDWIKRELDKLRPYSEAIEAWKDSNYTDESTLLRGQTLQNALDWSRGKSLSDLDYQFLSASQNLDKREAEIRLETERKANKILAIAHQKARRRIQIGSAFLIVSLLGASLALFQVKQAWEKVEEAKIGIRLQRDGDTALRQFQVESIESLVSALQAGIELQKIVRDGREFTEYPATSPMLALQQILDNIQEKNQLHGHRGTIYSVSISPNGEIIATASEDGTVRLWDRHGKPIRAIKSHQGAVYSVAFSPDGEKIATASRDGTARLWNLPGKLLHTLRGHRKSVDDASFSPDGRTVATASRDGTIKIWDLAGKLLSSLGRENIDSFYSVSFSPDGKLLAGATGEKTAKIWDNNGKLKATLADHQDYVNNVTFSPTGEFLVTASSDGTAKLWNRQGEELATLRGHQESVFDAVISRDGKRVVTGSSDRTARIWDIGNITQNTANTADNTAVGIDSSGSTVAIATKDGTISLVDSRGKTPFSFPSEMSSIYSLAFSPDGRVIATVGRKGEVKIWNRQGILRTEFPASPVPLYSVAFSPDSRELVTGSSDGRVQRWDWQSDRGRSIDSFRADTHIIYDIALSPDGEKIATASRGSVKIWDKKGNLLATIARDSFPIYGVSFSPDGQHIATISRDGTARQWDTGGNLLAEYPIAGDIVYSIAFRPDGQEISIVSRNGRVINWPVESRSTYLQKLLVKGCVWLEDYLANHPEEREKLRACQSVRATEKPKDSRSKKP